ALHVVGDRVADGGGVRGAAEAGDVRVAVFQQVADGELGAAEVVGDDGDVVDRLGAFVEQDDPGVPGVYLGRGQVVQGVADEDQAGDAHPQEGAQVVHLALADVVGVADQHHLPALGRGLFHGVRHLPEEGLAGVGHDQAYEVRAPGRHRLGDAVGPVPQFFDRGEDTLARGRGDRPGSVVDDIADDGGGGARQPRHVIPGYLGHARSLRGYTG